MENKNNVDINDYILRFVYVSSMRDAVRQGAYTGKRKWLEEESVYKVLSVPIKEHIEKIISGGYTDQDDYNSSFFKLAEDIQSRIKGKKGTRTDCGDFSFGNAQKLINMIIKYLFISTYNADCNKRESFKCCHCPMDGQMLIKIWNKKEKEFIENGTIKKEEFLKPWGSITHKNGDRYDIFQKAVRDLAQEEGLIPIGYDFKEWGNDNRII